MKHGKLLELCGAIIESFNPDRVTPSTHADQFVVSNKALVADVNASEFVREVFFGVLRHESMLSIAVDGLYVSKKGEVLRADVNPYTVACYLICVRVEEMTFDEFRRCAIALPPHKIVMLLEFLFDETNMNGWLHDQWSLVYDHAYVENVLLHRMHAVLPDVSALIAQLKSDDTYGRSVSPQNLKKGETGGGVEVRTITEPQPFKLTVPKPRVVVPPPAVVPTVTKSHPTPDSLYNTSLEAVERAKAERREELRQQALDKQAQAPQFKLNVLERPNNLEQVRAEVEAQRNAPMQKVFKAQPAPTFDDAPTVRLNAASVLREDARFRKQQEQDAAAIRTFEIDMRDSAEFLRWKAEMLSQDELEREQMIQQRRQDMAQAQEAALKAMEQKRKDNQQHVENMRVEIEQWRQIREKELEDAIIAAKAMVEKVTAQKESVKAVRATMLDERKKTVTEATRESEQLQAARQRQQEEELARKRELILEIQAMEKVANAQARKPKEFDPTETSGVGVLEEMPLSELRQRLALLKVADKESRDRKRDNIVASKQDKQKQLVAKAKNIERMRARVAAEAHERRENGHQKDFKAKTAAERMYEKQILQVNDVLEAKRAEKRTAALKLAQEIKARKQQQQFVNADKSKMEELHWKSLQKGLERQTNLDLQEVRRQAVSSTEVRNKNSSQRARSMAAKNLASKEFVMDYDSRLAASLAEKEEYDDQLMERKRMQTSAIRTQSLNTTQQVKGRNPYNATLDHCFKQSAE